MKIKVRAFGLLQERTGGSAWKEICVSDGFTIKELILDLGMKNEMIMGVVKNGEFLPLSYKIKEGDELKIIPFISGG